MIPEYANVAKPEPGEKEFHNVFLFGAGASFDAGVPLLSSFVDTM
jgi:hypothetical protein